MCFKEFKLSDEDREIVSNIVKKATEGRKVTRALILKLKDKNYTNIEAADIAEVTPRTVINVLNYYESAGLNSALNDDPRPGQPVKFDDRIKAKVVATVCSNPPEGFDRWTLDLLKEEVEKKNIVNEISRDTIRLILREHDLKPWQYQMWCVPDLTDEYISRMEDILNLYELDYNGKEPVICLDEKPVALFGDKRELIPFSSGKPTRVDYEYSRNGSANVFCAVEPLKGTYYNKVTEKKKKDDFAEFLKEIYDNYKHAKRIHLVMDNYSTHFENSLIQKYGENEGSKIWKKFEIHYTPVHASWLNQAEISIGMYSRQCLGKTRINDIEFLRKKTASWNRIINEKQTQIKWSFTSSDAKEKFKYV